MLELRLPESLRNELKASGINEQDFSRMLLGRVLSSFLVSASCLAFISARYSEFSVEYALLVSGFFSWFVGYAFYIRPFTLSVSREKEIDSNLIFAARELCVHLRTGTDLKGAFRSITPSGYLGTFFRKAYTGLSGGEPEEYVFGALSKRTTSRYLQRLFAILMLSKNSNIVPSLEQYIDEAKKARSRKMHEYELRSSMFSKILPLLFIGSASLVLVFCITGFHFSAHLPLPFIIALNFVAMPFAMLLLLNSLKSSNPMV